jgi:hypothetical protein
MNAYPEDNLDHLLDPPRVAASEELRRRVLRQTTAVVGRRSRQRRVALVLALAASVLLVVSGVFVLVANRDKPNDVRSVPGPIAVETSPPETLAVDAPAAAIERFGETSSPGQRSAFYRRAGDRFLLDEADPQDALRCYTQALDDGSEADLQVSAEDSWLLMALKIDRNKEKKNANRD